MVKITPTQLVLGLLIVFALLWGLRRLLVLVRLGQESRRNLHRARQSSRRGYEYEKDAKHALVSMGFKVIEHQPNAIASYWIDQEFQETKITADYLVERDGERAIVEVKSGRKARATHRDTRRQLFEYHHTFNVNAVYLFDYEANRLQRVDFDETRTNEKDRKKAIFGYLIAAFLGFFAGYYLTH